MSGLLDQMPAAAFEWWAAYADFEPFGQAREDIRWAIQTAVIANQFRSKKSRAIKPEEVLKMLRTEPPQPMTGKQIDRGLRVWVAGMQAAAKGRQPHRHGRSGDSQTPSRTRQGR